MCVYYTQVHEYFKTGSFLAVEVTQFVLQAIGTFWMMWVVRSYAWKPSTPDIKV